MVIVLVALLLTAILASAALAIDLGSFYQAQTKAQSAADAAALAAAQDLGGTNASNADQDGTTLALTNYPGATVSVSEPTTTSAKVVINATSPSYFGTALGITKANISATAVAGETGGSTMCTTAGVNCFAIFAMDSSCASGNYSVDFGGGGNTINGAVWSNGSVDSGGGGSHFNGGTYYGNGSGCEWNNPGGGNYFQGTEVNNGVDPSGTTAETATTAWPIDYRTDFPSCSGSSCKGPSGTPSFCTQAWTSSSMWSITPASGQIYCDVGTGTASTPSTWNGSLTLISGGSDSSPVEATYVAGNVGFTNGGQGFEACGYSAAGYVASGCDGTGTAAPTPSTQNYPIFYVTGTGTPFNEGNGGDQFTGDIFAPNGEIAFDGGGETVGFLEGQDVDYAGGGMTGDGPKNTGTISSGGQTVSLLQ